MRALEFPPSVLEQIDHDRFHHPCPQIQKRMEVLRLAAHGIPRTDIIRLSGLSRASVQRATPPRRIPSGWPRRREAVELSGAHQRPPETRRLPGRLLPRASTRHGRRCPRGHRQKNRRSPRPHASAAVLKKNRDCVTAKPAACPPRPIPSPRRHSTTARSNPC